MRVEEGQGWRLQVDHDRQPFPVLIGGSTWAIELAADEALALAAGVALLRSQHEALADRLVDQEELELDWERDRLWIGLTLQQGLWSLRFVLDGASGRRGVEAGWDSLASPAIALALDALPGLFGEALLAAHSAAGNSG